LPCPGPKNLHSCLLRLCGGGILLTMVDEEVRRSARHMELADITVGTIRQGRVLLVHYSDLARAQTEPLGAKTGDQVGQRVTSAIRDEDFRRDEADHIEDGTLRIVTDVTNRFE